MQFFLLNIFGIKLGLKIDGLGLTWALKVELELVSNVSKIKLESLIGLCNPISSEPAQTRHTGLGRVLSIFFILKMIFVIGIYNGMIDIEKEVYLTDFFYR